jgi:ABC-type uncharacterized transport system permease subunit
MTRENVLLDENQGTSYIFWQQITNHELTWLAIWQELAYSRIPGKENG